LLAIALGTLKSLFGSSKMFSNLAAYVTVESNHGLPNRTVKIFEPAVFFGIQWRGQVLEALGFKAIAKGN